MVATVGWLPLDIPQADMAVGGGGWEIAGPAAAASASYEGERDLGGELLWRRMV